MKKSLGLWGLAAALSLCLTACGMGNGAYNGNTPRNNANSNGTVTNGDGTLTGNRGATDFGDKGAIRNNGGAAYDSGKTYDNGMTYSDGTPYDNGATYDNDMKRYNETARNTDGRSALEEASEALRRARDSIGS